MHKNEKGKVLKQVFDLDIPWGFVSYPNHTRRLASIYQTCPDLEMYPITAFLQVVFSLMFSFIISL